MTIVESQYLRMVKFIKLIKSNPTIGKVKVNDCNQLLQH